MNRTLLQQKRGKLHIFLIALIYFFLCGISFSHAKEYKDGTGVVIGTDDSRLVATIIETEIGVTMQVIGIGKMNFDGIEYDFFIKQDELVMSDKTFTQEFNYGNYNSNPPVFLNNIDIADNLVKGGGKGLEFELQTTSGYRMASEILSGYPSSVAGMDALVVSLFNKTGRLEIPEGEINLIFTCYFKKKNPGRNIDETDIGMGVKTSFSGGGFFCPKWVHSGFHLTYATNEVMEQLIVPQLFTYRSPSSVTINDVSKATLTSITLNGNFKRGNMPPSNDLLEGYSEYPYDMDLQYNGRLNWDQVTQCGFIYTEEAVALSVKEYSDILLIEGKEYPFPTEPEITTGKFIRNGYTFYIVSEPNSDNNSSVDYSIPLNDLSPTTYSAWPYIKYLFETSREYPCLGDSIRFTPYCNIPVPDAQDQSFCGAVTVSELVASVPTGTELKWYDVPVDGNPLQSTDLLKEGTYYARAVEGSCSSLSVGIKVTDAAAGLDKPIVITPQFFCDGTVADLKATGSDSNIIEWYEHEQGGSALPSNTPLSEGIYYASQRSGACHSKERAQVQVNIGTPTAPDAQDQSFCGAATVSELVASVPTGTELKWYDVPVGGNPLQGTDLLKEGTYYARAVEGSCSSLSVEIKVTDAAVGLDKPIVITPQSFCNGTVADLKATGSDDNIIEWYEQEQGGSVLPPNTPLSEGIYYASQRSGACHSKERAQVQVNIRNIIAPDAQDQSFCGAVTVSELVASIPAGTELKWYDVPVGGNPLQDTDLLKEGFYYARAVDGSCSSLSVKIKVTDGTAGLDKPTVITPQFFCDGTIADLKATGRDDSIIEWYEHEQGGSALPPDTPLSEKIYYASQRSGACHSNERAQVQVTIGSTIPSNLSIGQSSNFLRGESFGKYSGRR